MNNDVIGKKIGTEEITLFRKLFVGREDAFAEQFQIEGKFVYRKIARPIEDKDIFNHLLGTNTYGTYVISENNSCRFVIFDVDIPKETKIDNLAWKQVKSKILQLKITAIDLGIKESQILIEYSGRRGYHLWIIFKEAIPSSQAYSFAKLILIKSGVQGEFFPKQDGINPETGFGNLVKMPSGVHKVTNQRSQFVDEAFNPYPDQFGYLSKIELVSVKQVEEILSKHNISLEPRNSLDSQLETSDDVEFDLDKKGGSLESLLSKCKALLGLKEKADKTGHLTHQERLAPVNMLPLFGDIGELELHEIIKNCATSPNAWHWGARAGGALRYRGKRNRGTEQPHPLFGKCASEDCSCGDGADSKKHKHEMFV